MDAKSQRGKSMSKNRDIQSNANKGNEKVPDSRSHEDFGPDAGSEGPASQNRKGGGKEETGATEAGNEDKGAKM
jgi:hypothetical protein